MRRLLCAATLLSSALVLAGCGDDTGDSSGGGSKGEGGGSGTSDGVTLKVLEAQTTTDSIENSPPDAGDVFVIVDVQLTNDSPDSIPLAAPAFAVKDDGGVEYHGDPRTALIPGGCDLNASVASDGETSCKVVFAPPANAKLEQLVYEWEEGRVEVALPAFGEGGGTGASCADRAIGTWRLAVSTQLGKNTPLYFDAQVVKEGEGLALTFTPLVTPYIDTGSVPFEPTGNPIVVHANSVGVDGALHFETGSIEIPGDANAISGSAIRGELTFDGTACPTSNGETLGSFCGTVIGHLTSPITFDLTGGNNFFAFNAPGEPAVYDCAGSLPSAP